MLTHGIVSQQHGWIVPNPLGYDMHRHAPIEEQSRMGAAEMVEGEAEPLARLANSLLKLRGLRGVLKVPGS